MKTPLLIVLMAVVFGVGSTLAIMNNSCKRAITHGALLLPTSDTTQRLDTAKRVAGGGLLPTRSSVVCLTTRRNSMKTLAIALAAFVSLGLAIPAFAMEKKDTMPAEKKMVVHHHHHHHMMKPEPKS